MKRFTLWVIIGVPAMIILAVTLGVCRIPTKIQVLGTLDSLDVKLKGGLSFKSPNVSDITLRAEEITLDSISECSFLFSTFKEDRTLGDSTMLMFQSEPTSDILQTLKIKPPVVFNVEFQHSLWEMPDEYPELLRGDLFYYYIHSTKRSVLISMRFKDLSLPSLGSVFAVYGKTKNPDLLTFQVYSPPFSPYPIEFKSLHLFNRDEEDIWELWFPSDSSATYHTIDFKQYLTPRLRLKGFARYGVLNLIPFTPPQRDTSSMFLNSSFGLQLRYRKELASKNEFISEGRSILYLSTRLDNDSDSLNVKITSALRPSPFVASFGDKVTLKGKFSMVIKPDSISNYIYVSGLATSVKINNSELIPSMLDNWHKALLAIAAFAIGLFALINLLYNLFIKWPSEQRSPKPKRGKSTK